MMSFIERIQSCEDYIGGKGKTEKVIAACEAELGLAFAPEYKDYLAAVGLACFDGREITGICKSARLNVVTVTKDEREYNREIPSNLYVVEEVGIDDIVIWQASTGEVFRTIPGSNAVKVGESLRDYYFGVN